VKITNKNLHKAIREFNNQQRIHIAPDMFILWEYKLTKTDGTRDDLYNIVKKDNVYLRLASDELINSNSLNTDEFFFMLSLYKEQNIKLVNFCSKMIKDF
jgi:hypothetical protein